MAVKASLRCKILRKRSLHENEIYKGGVLYFQIMTTSSSSVSSIYSIHLIPKWRSINYSFVCMFISPLCLIFTPKFFCVFYMLTRHQGLVNMQTKELFIGRHFGIRCIRAVEKKKRDTVFNLKPGFHIVVSVVSVVSVVRKKFIGQIKLYENLPYKCSIQQKR